MLQPDEHQPDEEQHSDHAGEQPDLSALVPEIELNVSDNNEEVVQEQDQGKIKSWKLITFD